jgi:hypothetical protein
MFKLFEKKMKKLFLSLIVLLLSFVSNAQSVLKVRTTHSCEKHTDYYGNWTDWSEWKEANILIVVDSQQDRITIYTETTQTFDIIENEGQSLSDKGDPTFNYYCVDENGTKCRIRIVKRTSGNQIYADYSNLILCFNIKNID